MNVYWVVFEPVSTYLVEVFMVFSALENIHLGGA
jgi:hypothetical protein